MFIDFAGMMININYIISIYKNENHPLNNKIISYNIVIIYNNIQNSKIISEYYKDINERNKRFNKIINLINKQ